MHPFMNPTLARLHHQAFLRERMHDAAQYHVGQPSGVLRLVAGGASRTESIGRAIKGWSQRESPREASNPSRTVTFR